MFMAGYFTSYRGPSEAAVSLTNVAGYSRSLAHLWTVATSSVLMAMSVTPSPPLKTVAHCSL
ncbi:hypothetical protein D3C83_242360 [compost metagenome]